MAARAYAFSAIPITGPRLFQGETAGTHLVYSNIMKSSPTDLDERIFECFCDVIRYTRTIPGEPGVRGLIDQLVTASGSVAANRQEATSASSRREFIRFNEIALRSAKETVLWLRAFEATGIGNREQATILLGEARQLTRILGSIIIRTKTTVPDKSPI